VRISVAGKSRRSEHTLQFYCIALDLPFRTYLFSKSDIKHPPPYMYLLDKYLNSCIYPLSMVCVLIVSRNRKITMRFFLFKGYFYCFSPFGPSIICVIILGTHFQDTSHRTCPTVPVCLFVCDTWPRSPFLFFFSCIPSAGWKLGPSRFCSAAGRVLRFQSRHSRWQKDDFVKAGIKEVPLGSAAQIWAGGGGKCW